jgi:hypothetical protein
MGAFGLLLLALRLAELGCFALKLDPVGLAIESGSRIVQNPCPVRTQAVQSRSWDQPSLYAKVASTCGSANAKSASYELPLI